MLVRREVPADAPRRRELRPPCRGPARGRPRDRLREVHPRPRPMQHGGRVLEGRRHVRERPGPRCDPRERPGPPLPRQQPHARELRDRVLSVRDRRQQLLRAVARGRWARRLPAGEQDLEADAQRVRGAAHRPGHRRGAPGIHREAQGVLPRLRGLSRVALLRPGRGRPNQPSLVALASVLADPTFELLPLKNATDQEAALPREARVSVTASPAKGLEATVALSVQLEGAGFRVVPHRSARMVRDEAHLRGLLAPLTDAGIDRAFVVGGDAQEPGEYPDGLALLRAMADLGIAPTEIGVPCYPQGHAFIPDDALLDALRAKAGFASYMTTQLCFDPVAISSWLTARRADGIALPVRIGIPGVAAIPKLIEISARIGVRDASRFILKNARFVGELLASGGVYRPTGLLMNLGPLIADAGADVIGLHIYTFNQVASTEAWRRERLEKMGRDTLTS